MSKPAPATTLHLAYRPPFDWPFFLRYFQGRATPGVEAVADGGYLRSIVLGRTSGLLRIRNDAANSRLVMTIEGLPVSKHADEILTRVGRMFDIAADMDGMHRALLADARLAAHVGAAPGLRVPGAWSAFEVLARAIVGQQVTVKAATTIMGRIAERFGYPQKASRAEAVRYTFPSPRALAEADMTGIGMPSKRVAALQGVARAIADGAIPFADAGGEVAGLRESLLALPGIGPWTVEYFALRALRDPDAWPGTDLVLKRALMPNPAARMSPRALLEASHRWKPWRAYAAIHLWNAASIPAEPDPPELSRKVSGRSKGAA